MDLIYVEPISVLMFLLLCLVFKMVFNRVYLIQRNYLDQGERYPIWGLDFWQYTIVGLYKFWWNEKNDKTFTEALRWITNVANVLFYILLVIGVALLLFLNVYGNLRLI